MGKNDVRVTYVYSSTIPHCDTAIERGLPHTGVTHSLSSTELIRRWEEVHLLCMSLL